MPSSSKDGCDPLGTLACPDDSAARNFVATTASPASPDLPGVQEQKLMFTLSLDAKTSLHRSKHNLKKTRCRPKLKLPLAPPRPKAESFLSIDDGLSLAKRQKLSIPSLATPEGTEVTSKVVVGCSPMLRRRDTMLLPEILGSNYLDAVIQGFPSFRLQPRPRNRDIVVSKIEPSSWQS